MELRSQAERRRLGRSRNGGKMFQAGLTKWKFMAPDGLEILTNSTT